MQDALAFLRLGYYMAKIDLRHAYRSVHIHPSNYQATGLKWKFSNSNHFTYFVDTRLPYGGRRAPGIFHRLAQAVKRMMARRGFKMIVAYLDDFLIVASSWAQCMEAYECLLELLQNLGFEISFRKVVPPTQCLTFLGVQIDSVDRYLSLPQNKLADLQAFVQEFLYRRRACKRQLQVLAGKINWACQVVCRGRTFLRRILDAMNSLQSPSARFRFTPEFYADLLWWSQFLQVFNGKRMFLDTVPELTVQTDACFEAAGAIFNGDWRYFNFGAESKVLTDLHINYKEVLAVVMAAENWRDKWTNRHIIIHSDNQAAVSIINKGSTENPIIMYYLRRLFWLSAIFNFRITAKYIEGENNVIADDAISRLHSLAYFYHALSYSCRYKDIISILGSSLLCNMPFNSALFLSIRFHGYYIGKRTGI